MKEERNDLNNGTVLENKGACALTDEDMAKVSGGEDERQPCPYWKKACGQTTHCDHHEIFNDRDPNYYCH